MNDTQKKRISTPLTDDVIRELHAGDMLLLNGVIYVARDAAHQRMNDALDAGQPLPFDFRGQVVYYMGPTPPKPGQVIGSAGPTTAGRMDVFVPRFLSLGLKGMIGKGERSQAVKDAIKECIGVYFASYGGAAVVLSRCIKQAEVVAYDDLGPEAIRRLVVEDLPVVVAADIYGGDVYADARKQWQTEQTRTR